MVNLSLWQTIQMCCLSSGIQSLRSGVFSGGVKGVVSRRIFFALGRLSLEGVCMGVLPEKPTSNMTSILMRPFSQQFKLCYNVN